MGIITHIIKTSNGEFHNVSYIIENEITHEGVLIDPAWESDKYETVAKRRKIKLTNILLTHSHIDHIDLVDYFIDAYNSNVFISQIEAKYYDFNCENLQLLHDGDVLNIAGVKIKCYLTPGHTLGSMCYEINNNLFVGDTFFFEGCGNCNYSNDSIKKMYDSIQKIKKIFRDSTKVYSGHIFFKDVGHFLSEIKNNNISFLLDEEAFCEYQKRRN